MSVATCFSPAELRHLIDGQSSEQEIVRLEEHVAQCASCLAALKKELHSFDTLNNLNLDTLPPDAVAQGLVEPHVVESLIKRLEQLTPNTSVVAEAIMVSCQQCGRSVAVVVGQKAECPACNPATLVHAEPNSMGPTTPKNNDSVTSDTFAVDYTDDCANEDQPWAFLAPAQTADEIGRLGSYRILKVLGHGGMGVVFEAEDPDLQRTVAIKAMLPAVAASASAKKRFLREARAAASIKHDHIVSIYQVSEDRGAPFLVMEFLHGEPLDVRLKRENVLSLTDVITIGRHVAEGLTAAHEHGLIHRDIKPGNIWLEKKGERAKGYRCKILDFGLARSADDQTHLTQSGTIVGTLAYMAPEQAGGKNVDHRCDLFSLGVLLYRACTGTLPFKGDNSLAILSSLALDEPPPPLLINMELPAELSDLIMRLLAKNPAQRPASAHEVAEELAAIGQPERTERVGLQSRASSPTENDRTEVTHTPKVVLEGAKANRRFRMIVTVAVAVGLLLALTAGLVYYIPTKNGVITVEINDPDIEVVLTKTGAKIKGDKQGEFIVTPGEQTFKIKRGDLEFETDKFIFKKGDTLTIRVEYVAGKLEVVKADGQVIASKTTPTVAKQPDPKPPITPVAKGRSAWTPTPEQQQFLDAVAVLSVKDRINAVQRKIVELNSPRFDNSEYMVKFEPNDVLPTKARSASFWLHQLWPLAAFPSLTSLDVEETSVIDFRPVTHLPLTELHLRLIIDNTTSEEALREMSTLKQINSQPVADYWANRLAIRQEIDKFAPLAASLSTDDQQTWVRGMMQKLHPKVPINNFGSIMVSKTGKGYHQFRGYDVNPGVYDFSPVRALPIEEFLMMDGRLIDATPFAKMKLKVLTLQRGYGARDLTPLTGLPLEDVFILGEPFSLKPLQGSKLKKLCVATSDLKPLQGMKIEHLEIENACDLKPLEGMPLKVLKIKAFEDRRPVKVTDLTPLKGMPLDVFVSQGHPISDLSPLQGMKFKELAILESRVVDIRPLKDTPIDVLTIGRAHVDPVLATIPLQGLFLHFRVNCQAEEQMLRRLNIPRINGRSPADFWKEVERQRREDDELVARISQIPLDKSMLQTALWKMIDGPDVTIVDNAVTEVKAGAFHQHSVRYALFRAFPKLRKLTMESTGDYSPLSKLPALEELNCPPQEVLFNKLALKECPALKTINGKPAAEVLGK